MATDKHSVDLDIDWDALVSRYKKIPEANIVLMDALIGLVKSSLPWVFGNPVIVCAGKGTRLIKS